MVPNHGNSIEVNLVDDRRSKTAFIRIAFAQCMPNRYGMHTMRRTKATLIYKRTKNLRAVQLLLGHCKLDYLPRRTMSRVYLTP